jgi:hypothetical protein
LSRAHAEGLGATIAECSTPLWSDQAPEEHDYQLGKIQNLRVACMALDGIVIPAGVEFSFWRHVGRPVASRGYVAGRMLQEGCMVAAVGGGLCQLSNAIYETALQSSCRIIERHRHSRVVPGSAASVGRDATVAWNYVDLRFAPDRDMRISARLSADRLTIRLIGRSDESAPRARPAQAPGMASLNPTVSFVPRSCATCDEIDCHLHERRRPTKNRAQAFLVDEAWPEFRTYVSAAREPNDRLGRPISGSALGPTRHNWKIDGFDRVGSAPLTAISRSLGLRAAGRRGAAVRRAELAHAQHMARALGSLLTYEIDKVTVAQSYLPFLWRDGHLGGREVAVLMTSLPLAEVESRLDEAAARHPDHATLNEFRAPPWLVQAEAEALAICSRIISPHAEIAALFGERALRLPWSEPPVQKREARNNGGRIAFPGPTVARKGAYAVRDAAIALDLEVIPLGSELEGEGFWRDVRTGATQDWGAIDAVVQPAIVEHQPRRLLAALAAGVPVIATKACGIDPRPGLTIISPDDVDALVAVLAGVLSGQPD